jgi:RNA ligase (TIGR02306 family)
MRALASVRKIANLQPIEGADAIEVAVVDGWKVVVKKDEFKTGDLAIYMEIDSWVPTELAPFLSKGKEPREYNGVKGERLRTIKLRGQISQGLLLPMTVAFDWDAEESLWEYKEHPDAKFETGDPIDHGDRIEIPVTTWVVYADEGDDLTEALGIQKWEAVLPAQLQGQAKGTFPTDLIPKTDQERIQNCFRDIERKARRNTTEKVWNAETQTLEEFPAVHPADFQEPTYEVTLKLDGSSCTIFRWENELRVCSRNLELKINDENKDNTFVAMALKLGDKIPEGFAFQGEICGPGIQGNREGFKEHKFFVFDVFNIREHVYLAPDRRRFLSEYWGHDHVPVIGTDWNAPESVEAGLALADGPSINSKVREGLVWKCNTDPSFSFKTISNQFLLKGGD